MAAIFDLSAIKEGQTSVFPQTSMLDFQVLPILYENRKVTSECIKGAASNGSLLGYICVGKRIKLQQDLSNLILLGTTIGKSASDMFDVKPEYVEAVSDLLDRKLLRVIHVLYISMSTEDIRRQVSSDFMKQFDIQFSTVKRSVKSCNSLQKIVSRYAR